MLHKITYSCNNCGWSKSLSEMWADLAPTKCPVKKCKTSFLKDPEKLSVKNSKNDKKDTKNKNERRTKQQSEQPEQPEQPKQSE